MESSIGDCQFCHAKGTVDLVEHRSKWYLFGVVPTNENIDRLAQCQQCGRYVKEVHYHLRHNAATPVATTIEAKQPYQDENP